MPLKYDKIFSCLLCLWQPLRLDVFLWARRFSLVKRNESKNLYQILYQKNEIVKCNKVCKMLTKAYGESAMSKITFELNSKVESQKLKS